VDVHGDVSEGFGPVGDAFVENFEERGDLGAAVCVYVEGEKVVDLWGGIADRTTGGAWTSETSAIVFSCTKALVALCIGRLVEQDRLDLDDTVAKYWPEFAQNGKETITIRCALSHRAGLMALDHPLTRAEVLSWTPVIEAIEAQEPLWDPCTAFAYHPLTYGHIGGEVIRRVTGLMPRDYFAREIAAPLGVSTSIGLPKDEQDVVARIEPPLPDTEPEQAAAFRDWFASSEVARRAMSLGTTDDDNPTESPFNDPDVRAAQLPAVNGITNARDLAKTYAAIVGDTDMPRLLAPTTIADMTTVQSEGRPWTGPDISTGLRWGTGFMLHSPPARPMLGNGSFGHDGAGGQLGFADREYNVGFGYVNNQMGGFPDDRAKALTAAVEACLAA